MGISINYLSTAESCYFVNWFGKNYTVTVKNGHITAVKNKKGQQLDIVPLQLSINVLNYHRNFS